MKTRPVILVVVTLIIGFFLGMLTSAQIRNYRLKPVRVFYSEEKFRQGMYQAIQPDEGQKVKIDAILDKYSKMNSEATAAFRKEFETRMDKFRNELDSNLTPEQIVRLKELDEQRRKMMKSHRNGRRSDYDEHKRGERQRPGSDTAGLRNTE
ncbi:MAG: hypothetical protein A2X05_06315 [Bacteroidetes bacterium GWE2_41_25]|nr:MAG: hypothetical protein A2X05_06315 [Bacteroidetes bacterium GWE2_41_25]HCU20481.1 hypothetical protein [Bacteroidales bacterium]